MREELVVREATKEEHLQTLHTNYLTWGKPYKMTLDGFLAREARLHTIPFANGFKCYILTKASSNEILCSCEGYMRPCVIFRDGQEVQGTCYAMAFISTPPAHKKKGYASLLLERVSQMVGKEFDVSNLFSDIGHGFYERKGWKLHPPVSLVVDVSQTDAALAPKDPSLQDLTIDDLDLTRELLQKDLTLINDEAMSFHKRTGQHVVLITPTAASIERLWVWNDSMAIAAGLEVERPRRIGVCCSNRDFILWTADLKRKMLEVTRIRYSSPESIQILMEEAKREAQLFGLTSVHVWDPQDDLQTISNSKVVVREDELTCLNYKGSKDVKWFMNEKYCWV